MRINETFKHTMPFVKGLNLLHIKKGEISKKL
jgi:hypothetical protein